MDPILINKKHGKLAKFSYKITVGQNIMVNSGIASLLKKETLSDEDCNKLLEHAIDERLSMPLRRSILSAIRKIPEYAERALQLQLELLNKSMHNYLEDLHATFSAQNPAFIHEMLLTLVANEKLSTKSRSHAMQMLRKLPMNDIFEKLAIKLIIDKNEHLLLRLRAIDAFSQEQTLSQPVCQVLEMLAADSDEEVMIKTDAHQILHSLKQWFKRFGFQRYIIPRDGNCFFKAVAHQLHVKEIAIDIGYDCVRAQIVGHIIENWKLYEDYTTDEQNEFIEKISLSGTWAEDIVISAAARALNVTIVIIYSNWADPTIYRIENPVETIYLAYTVGLHYDSLLRDEKIRLPQENIDKFIARAEIMTQLAENEDFEVKQDDVPEITVKPNNDCDQEGNTPLHLAAKTGDLDKANSLLKDKANVDSENTRNMTPLFMAVRENKYDMVVLFTDNGADVDHTDANSNKADEYDDVDGDVKLLFNGIRNSIKSMPLC